MDALYPCPRCGGDLLFGELDDGGYLVSCSLCGLRFATSRDADSRVKAFIELQEAFEKDELEELGKAGLEELGLVKPAWAIEEELRRAGLSFDEVPPVVKDVLMGQDYVVKYALWGASEPSKGVRVEESGLAPQLVQALRRVGIERLYKFQEEAIRKILDGKNVLVVAPTATGKTEAFALPIFHMVVQSRARFGGLRAQGQGVSALFIYPTKALNRDQLGKLQAIGGYAGITVAVLDGDTPQHERRRIYRSPPDVLITNFDMIDYHLKRRDAFARLISSAKFVVLDEAHQYVGAFGANVHFILRRMRRLFGDFQVVGASATISNPEEFWARLVGGEVDVVKCAEGRRGRVHLVMLYPTGRSFRTMMVDVLARCVGAGLKTLVFANTHKDAETIFRIAKRRGLNVLMHRGGLPENHRREVEKLFKLGRARCIVATPTLELGIDIGDLDAVVSMVTGYTRFLQRVGRAGRKGQESFCVIALRDEDPMSTYYKSHPETYFSDVDPAYVEPGNPVVAEYQIIFAAMDRPLKPGEFQEFQPVIERLKREGMLAERSGQLYATPEARKKTARYNIRGIGEIVEIYEGKRRIGEREMPLAARELFPNAVYMHGGRNYLSKSFTFKGGVGIAEVEQLSDDYPYRTQALFYSQPNILEVIEKRNVFGVEVMYCRLNITQVVEQYIVREILSDEIVGIEPLADPIEYSFDTFGLVFKAPQPDTEGKMAKKDVDEFLTGSFHAVEHVVLESSNMLTGGGSGEVGGVSMGTSGVIFAYDACPGGNGISLLLYRRLDEAFRRALTILEKCGCESESGCPRCTHSWQCGSNNEPLSKSGATSSLRKILERKETTVTEDYVWEKSIV
ncbi:MAG: DEAD/DEAH box helicase [Candidatus Freyarchaeota archaeon]|nr:DEAD/DEAH box helicase [Candidatus Jordarchaeia archaeon]